MIDTVVGYADVLVGLQYGDEGKAKVVDLLAEDYDIIARFNGGANAGHTVITPHGEAKLMQIPSGAFHPGKLLYIGSGCAVNVLKLAVEINSLIRLGVSLDNRLFISHRCPIVQPHHIAFDLEHGTEIGTTGNGIGACYADQSIRMKSGTRTGLQLKDLCKDEITAFTIMQRNLSGSRSNNQVSDSDSQALIAWKSAWDFVKQFVTEDDLLLTEKVKAGGKVLFEGAQSVLLDVSMGEQPYVTSSRTGPSYAYVGGDLSCRYHRKSIGVVKAIMSRVGAGAFPSEFGGERSAEYCNNALSKNIGRDQEAEFNVPILLASNDSFDIGKGLRIATAEYGTGSGRPRRIGALDLVNLKGMASLHGIDEIYINRCDSLALFKSTREGKIPLIVGYQRGGESGIETIHFDSFETIDASCSKMVSLPRQLDVLLEFIEAYIGCKIVGAGIGPARHHNVMR